MDIIADPKKQVNFVLLGEPVGKQRPRFTRMGHVYTAKKTLDYEKQIMQMAWVAMKNARLQPTYNGVSLELTAYAPVPKSWSKARREAALLGAERPKKPDIDNILKAVMDGLNGVVYYDDQQVHSITARKMYETPDQPPAISVCVSWT